jgi:catechol 2,3-dioxygenase-like lactoylglutathione lyase family enzyme
MNDGPQLTHILLYVSDLARSRAFYVDTLGLEPQVEEDDYLRLSGMGVDLGLHRAYEPEQTANGGVELQLRVDDVDVWHRRLSAQRASFTQAPADMPWGARHAFLRDPDGYRLSIYTPCPDQNPTTA